MNELTDEERRRIEALTKEFASKLKTHPKGKYIFNTPNKAGNSNFSSVNFSNSGYVEDSNGIPNLIDEDFAAERALAQIKQLVIREDVQKMLVPQINAKNDITKRNKQRKLEFQKQLQKNY